MWLNFNKNAMNIKDEWHKTIAYNCYSNLSTMIYYPK